MQLCYFTYSLQDEYHSSYSGAPNDGSGWCNGECPESASDSNYNASDGAYRVLRGGGWGFSASNIRAVHRFRNTPSYQYSGPGGRLSRSIY